MKKFDYARAQSFEEASELLAGSTGSGTAGTAAATALAGSTGAAAATALAGGSARGAKAVALAGGTDILGRMKDDILPQYPDVLVDLKRIEGASSITVTSDEIIIGANTTLSALAESPEVRACLPALAQAAHSVATPLVRNLGTVGGNICQDVRCWFYRYPHEAGGRMECRRKGGETCYAILGDNRYHSVFGGMRCGANPCQSACPAATDIPAYLEQLRSGNTKGAAQILFEVNPLPAITSRVCAHPCQTGCNKSDSGDSVAIRNVERYVGDFALATPELFYAAPAQETGRRVAVIGSGPAGLSAAYYLRRLGHAVTVYDSKDEPGGMLRYAIPAYRLPKDIVTRLIEVYKNMGITFVTATQVGKDILASDLERDFDALYFATGTWKRPVLGLSGEELTVFGLDFLMEVHDWMDGKVGKEVLVAGGGNVAMDVAITAKRLGAKRVVLAALETEDIMPAGSEEIARAREEGVEINGGWGLSRVISEGGIVSGMELKRCTQVYDEQGRFVPVYDESDTRIIEAQNILMAVGQQVDLNFLDEKYQMELTARGLIEISGEEQMTSREGVFAAGDVTTGPSTVIQCIANGHAAARGINRYLGGAAEHVCTGLQEEKPFLTFDVAGVKEPVALKLAELPVSERSLDREDETAPDVRQAFLEASRCMNCGCYAVAPSDITPVLMAAGARIITTSRELTAEEFAASALKVEEVLAPGELVRELRVPIPKGAQSAYDKFRLREAVDWAIVALASVCATEGGKVSGIRLVLGGVAPVPLRLHAVEGYLLGRTLDAQTIAEASEKAVSDCLPLAHNLYKVQEIRAFVGKTLARIV